MFVCFLIYDMYYIFLEASNVAVLGQMGIFLERIESKILCTPRASWAHLANECMVIPME